MLLIDDWGNYKEFETVRDLKEILNTYTNTEIDNLGLKIIKNKDLKDFDPLLF